jgi:hypothetical protein
MMGSVGELSKPPLQSVSESGEPNGVERAHLRSRTLGFMNRREFLTVAAAIGAHGAWGFRSPRPSRSAWQERRDLYSEELRPAIPVPCRWRRRLRTSPSLPTFASNSRGQAPRRGPAATAPQFPNVLHAAVRYQTDGPRRVPLRRRKRSQRCNFVIEHRSPLASPLASLRDVAPTVDR